MNHLKNTELALKYWLTVPSRNVSRGLANWSNALPDHPNTCNTIACFGGWIPAMPEFAAMGVRANPIGAPEFRNLRPSDISEVLFGHNALFEMPGDCDYDTVHAFNDIRTGHQVVRNRLKQHAKFLKTKS